MITLTPKKEHELMTALKVAITAELERRVDDYCDKNPCTRLSVDETRVYTISGEDQLEEAQEDSVQTLIQDIENHLPKLADVMWDIMQEMRICKRVTNQNIATRAN